jgi:hypothetical protein
MDDLSKEVSAGIELERQRIERHGNLKVSKAYQFSDRTVHYFLIMK